MEDRQMTFGEKAVGLSFNPSGDMDVRRLKEQFAAVIDTMDNMRFASSTPESMRMFSVAITEAQGAQMWAVKAATWKD
jgi:hypothetical protein